MPRFEPLHLEPDALLAHFDRDAVARGVAYAREGRVALEGWAHNHLLLTGICQGSGRNTYLVSAAFEADGTVRHLTATRCTCPVGDMCKHGVALVLTASGATGSGATPPDATPPDARSATHGTQVHQPPAQWRNVLGPLISSPEQPIQPDAPAPLGLVVELPVSTRHSPNPAPILRLVTIGKLGTWVRAGISWGALHRASSPSAGTGRAPTLDRFDSEHVRALRAIARAEPDGWSEDALSLGPAPADIWELLDDAHAAGVEFIAHKAAGYSAVALIPNSRMAFRVYHDTENVIVEPFIQLDGELDATGQVGLIGAPIPHGLFALCDQILAIGPFEAPPTRDALVRILSQGRIVIPDADLDEFRSTTLPALSGIAPVVIDEHALEPPTITGPVPVLTIRIDDIGSRVGWSTGYMVNNRLVEFAFGSDPGATAYRDAGREADTWHTWRPHMQIVATQCHRWGQQAIRYLLADPGDADVHAFIRDVDEDLSDAINGVTTELLARTYTYDLTETAVLCAEIVTLLRDDGVIVRIIGDPPDYVPAEDDPVIEIGVGDSQVDNDWLNLSISVDVAGYAVPLSDVLRELATGASHMLLPNGTYFPLTTPELLRLRELIHEARELGEIERGKVRRHSSNGSLWYELLSLGVVDRQLMQWHSHVAELSSATVAEPVEPPATLQADLRDYQLDGLRWLTFCHRHQIGGILADDMGLGKTVQTLALLAQAAADDPIARFLVIAPTSVVGNWVSEAQRFVPTLESVAITTTQAKAKTTLAHQIGDAALVVTSYTLFRLQFDAFNESGWAAAIFDEAQFVKNHHAKTHQCARQLTADIKFAITGTPMENNLMELWSLLSITSPGLFPSPRAFNDFFRKPIEEGNRERLALLRRRIRPVMLRRTKDQVVADLPPKQEQVLSLELTPKHDKIFQTRLTRERQKVLGLLGDWEENRFAIFRSLTMLRQLSLHAGLVDDAHRDVASSKIDYLAEQLPGLIAEGHSALVFSQFTGFLHLIRERLTLIGVAFSYLDGSMSAAQRQAAIAEFTGGTTRVFLISLKAGGFGLNLTEADYCFVCDPWWNPAAEAQAVDRAHRIGQSRPVTVYRLVSKGTIEEKVVELQERKRKLFTAVMDEGSEFSGVISPDDIRELIGDD